MHAMEVILAAALTAALLWQAWSGTAWIIGAPTKGRGWNAIHTEHLVYRDEHPALFWLSIAIQSSVIAYAWWGALR